MREPNQAVRMLQKWGKLIGRSKGGSPYYVLDGRVSCIHGDSTEYVGDYFVFCDEVRRGLWPDYRPMEA